MIRAGRDEASQPTSDTASPGVNGAPEGAGAPGLADGGVSRGSSAGPADGAAIGGATAATGPATGTATSSGPATSTATADETESADAPPTDAAGSASPPARGQTQLLSSWPGHLLLLAAYILAGVWAISPRVTDSLNAKMPRTQDVASFIWALWWVSHQVVHLGNPWFTHNMGAPAGVQLGFATTMPLAGLLLTPVTQLISPFAAYALLVAVTPGLLCYAMFRAARMWLNPAGAIAAGALFGLSAMLAWQTWYHVNIALGTLFLPLTIEAAIRLRRNPGIKTALYLGVAVGASVLVNQESTVIAVVLALLIVLPWLIGKLISDRASLRPLAKPLGIGAVVGLVVASPQLTAMWAQVRAGGASLTTGLLAQNYTAYGASLTSMFAPSPRLKDFGLAGLTAKYAVDNAGNAGTLEGLPVYGIVLTVLAVIGLLIAWRKRSTWGFLALWLVCSVVALGPTLITGGGCDIGPSSTLAAGILSGPNCHQYIPLAGQLHWISPDPVTGAVTSSTVPVSWLMPYTWLVHIPGFTGLREAERFTLVGLIGAAMLAGITVEWLSKRRFSIPVIAGIAVLAVFELGWSGAGGPGLMSIHQLGLEHYIEQDHSNSIVLDMPFGLRGGVSQAGTKMAPQPLLLAVRDGHPRSISYTAWVPQPTINEIRSHPFYYYLMELQKFQQPLTAAQTRRALADLKTLHLRWVIEWRGVWVGHQAGNRYKTLDNYLYELGFRRPRGSGSCLVSARPCPRADVVWLYRWNPSKAHIS